MREQEKRDRRIMLAITGVVVLIIVAVLFLAGAFRLSTG
jgi:predicted nucleic acid-binding Zn ribbon protein